MVLIGSTYTLATIVTDLSTRLDDSSHVRWSQAEKNLAVKTTIRLARGTWHEERLDDTNIYDSSTYRYMLPVNCERILSVYFAPDTSDEPRRLVVPSSYHREGNTLVFKLSYPYYDGNIMYISYIVYPNNLLTCSGTDGVISSTELTSATSTFITSGVCVGDEVEITGDTGGPYYVSSITSETVLALHKAPTAGSSKTFYIARYTDLPYEYLIFGAMGELHEMAARNRPGVEVEELVKWASYYRSMAEEVLKKQARHRASVRSY